MKYNISKKTAPKMPKLGKGTEIVSLLLSQASNDMHEPIVPMILVRISFVFQIIFLSLHKISIIFA